MGIGFKVAPGVRIRASSRGISAGIGPRAARVHVGTRGVGVSSGVGPVSGYTHLGGGGRRKSTASTRRASNGGPTKASIAAREREVKAVAREADIDRVVAIERALVGVHRESFPLAERVVLPPPEVVDPDPIRAELEELAGIPALVAATGGEAAPVAPPPEPVDRYELMREHRKRARAGIPLWSVRQRRDAARCADQEAESAAAAEAERRAEAQRVEQERLDGLWVELEKARAQVVEQTETNVAAERSRRAELRASEQAALDHEWERLQANDPEVTLAALEQAFADNEAPAAAIDCEGDHTTVVMQFVGPAAIIPEKQPNRTPTGKRTLKKRTKTEINTLYLRALGSNVLATVKEAFAVAPGTEVVQMIVIRREAAGGSGLEHGVIYLGEFNRRGFASASGASDPARPLSQADGAVLDLKGRTAEVVPLDLSDRPDLADVLETITVGLRTA